MTILELLAESDWDQPFFKKLARNDTAEARGHQAGMVLPKDLRIYFPTLDQSLVSSETPTVDRDIRGEMYSGTTHVADRVIRYQIQTWGGTRSPESRLTEGYQPLHRLSGGGDVLIIQRRFDSLGRFRFFLIRQGTPEFAEIEGLIGSRNWGALFAGNSPVTSRQIFAAAQNIEEFTSGPFNILSGDRTRVTTRQQRIARDSAFAERVRIAYDSRCAISGNSIMTPDRLHEVHSAHVVPVSENGPDDIRNGLALSQTLHWSFDRGLIGILPNRTVYVPRRIRMMIENSYLLQFHGNSINEATTPTRQAHPDALEWHFSHKVRQWD